MHEYRILESGKPLEQASKALVLLHGRGGSATDIIGLAQEFCDDKYYIAAPDATNHSWYPYGFMSKEVENEPWLSSAVATVKRLLDEISARISFQNIFLMGFSQGACLTLETAARYPNTYGGVIAFTGGLIGEVLDESKYSGDFKSAPIYIGNSDRDPHVPLQRSEESLRILEARSARVRLDIFPGMAHTITRQEVEAAKEFISF